MNNNHRLAYISKNEISDDPTLLKNEIQKILSVARVKNSEHGVTGALMYNTVCFAQVLEGPLDAVTETYERIQCDPRHSDVVILEFKEIEDRLFVQWSMGYIGTETGASRAFDRLTTLSDDAIAIKSNDIYDLMRAHMLEAETA